MTTSTWGAAPASMLTRSIDSSSRRPASATLASAAELRAQLLQRYGLPGGGTATGSLRSTLISSGNGLVSGASRHLHTSASAPAAAPLRDSGRTASARRPATSAAAADISGASPVPAAPSAAAQQIPGEKSRLSFADCTVDAAHLQLSRVHRVTAVVTEMHPGAAGSWGSLEGLLLGGAPRSPDATKGHRPHGSSRAGNSRPSTARC